MSKTLYSIFRGRLCNQIFRNLSLSIIAEKHNLFVDYSIHELIGKLGIELFVGENIHNHTIMLTDDNYFEILSQPVLLYNLNANRSYFQTKRISNYLYNYLQNDIVKQRIINKNPFFDRYNNNDDIFIHIRLTDVADYNPGIEYYLYVISIQPQTSRNIYVSSDDLSHEIIQQIVNKYPNTILLNYDEIQTIQFGSTCKYIILSQGTFSAVIGYLAFYSQVYYKEFDQTKIWHGDIFSIDSWNMVHFVPN